MANLVKWTNRAYKDLGKIDTRYRNKILADVKTLANFPDVTLDIKKLKGTESRYRLRIGRYRVLFEWIQGKMHIIEVQAVKRRDEQTYH